MCRSYCHDDPRAICIACLSRDRKGAGLGASISTLLAKTMRDLSFTDRRSERRYRVVLADYRRFRRLVDRTRLAPRHERELAAIARRTRDRLVAIAAREATPVAC